MSLVFPSSLVMVHSLDDLLTYVKGLLLILSIVKLETISSTNLGVRTNLTILIGRC